MCIFCGRVRDNGWGNRTFSGSEVTLLSNGETEDNDDRTTYTHCESSSCLRRWANRCGGGSDSDDNRSLDDESEPESESESESAVHSDDERSTQLEFMRIVERMRTNGYRLPDDFQLHYAIERVTDSDGTAVHVRSFLTEEQAQSHIGQNGQNLGDSVETTRSYEYSSADGEIDMLHVSMRPETQHDTVYFVG